MTGALGIAAPAKVNLSLRVLGRRRGDGYHEIETLMVALDLADELRARELPRPGATELTVEGGGARTADLGPPGDNLVRRAADAWREATGWTGGVGFHLRKRIPAGAGLGGGSSDAAAALRLLEALGGPFLDAAALDGLALGLGADVPFFLRGGACWGTGIGGRLAPAEVPPLHVLLLVPPFGCATGAVYKNLRAQWIDAPPHASISPVKAPSFKDLERGGRLTNDLLASAMASHPALADLHTAVVESGCPTVRMSGSGSTLFLASEGPEPIDRAEETLDFLRGQGVELVRTCTRTTIPRPRPVWWPHAEDRGG